MTEPAAAPGHPPRRFGRVWRGIAAVAVVGGLVAGGYVTRERWLPLVRPPEVPAGEHAHAESAAAGGQVLLSEQAQRNLRLDPKPLAVETYWKTLPVPGMVVDRPGHGDRGVVAPVTAVVAVIHRLPGDAVRPGDPLFTLKLLSESLHTTQTELFKAAQDIKLAEEARRRLRAAGGAVSEARLVEADAQITRLQVAVKAYRQELLNRGIGPAQLDGVAEGTFVAEVVIVAPPRPAEAPPSGGADAAFEVEALKVELGQQVPAGQTLCLLADHDTLAVEGRAFRDEAPLLERAAREGWPLEVDFREGDAGDWPPLAQRFPIQYLANTIDPETRTFRFLLPLENQSRVVAAGGRPLRLWRFRPGQRVRLLVPVDKLDGVFVLPPDAVAREGGEAYVFRQNGDTFDRKPVRVVHENGRAVVVADDGSVPAGVFVARNGAAQLNRMVKAAGSATPKGFHVHADGSVHTGEH